MKYSHAYVVTYLRGFSYSINVKWGQISAVLNTAQHDRTTSLIAWIKTNLHHVCYNITGSLSPSLSIPPSHKLLFNICSSALGPSSISHWAFYSRANNSGYKPTPTPATNAMPTAAQQPMSSIPWMSWSNLTLWKWWMFSDARSTWCVLWVKKTLVDVWHKCIDRILKYLLWKLIVHLWHMDTHDMHE